MPIACRLDSLRRLFARNMHSPMLRRWWRTTVLSLLAVAGLVAAPNTVSQVRYFYDELGRLVLVVAPDGASVQYDYDAAGNLLVQRRRVGTLLSISEFSPNQAPVGAQVRIFGTGFSSPPSSNAVRFNGVAASAVTSGDANSLLVVVPVGASTGKVSVTNAGGVATSTADFVVGTAVNLPTLVDFNPKVGTPGTVVTVTGTNFGTVAEDIKAQIGGVNVPVVKDATSPTATSLKLNTAQVPTSGRITLTTPAGKVISASDYFSLTSAADATAAEFRGRVAVNGPPVRVTTTATGKTGVVLFDALAGQRVHFATAAGTYALPSPLVARLYSPTGNLIGTFNMANAGYIDPSISGLDSTTGADRLALSGTYTVVLAPPSGGGFVDFSVFADVDGQISVDAASPTEVTITREGQNASYAFTGTAGQAISLIVTGNLLDDGVVGTTNMTNFYVRKFTEPTRILASGFIPTGSATKSLLDFTLPESGTYFVHVDPSGNDKGKVSLQLRGFVTGTLATTGTNPVVLGAGQSARMSFSAAAGKGFGVALTNLTHTPAGGTMVVTLRRPDLSFIRTWMFTGNTGSSFDIPPGDISASGTYHLDFDAGTYESFGNFFDSTAPQAAAFTIVFSSNLEGTLAIDATTATAFSSSRQGQNGRFTVTGANAGKKMSIVMTGNLMTDNNPATSNYTTVQLTNGTGWTTSTGIGSDQASNTHDFDLPAAGSYFLDVLPSGLDIGSFNLRLVSTLTGPMPIDAATPVVLSAGQNGRYTFNVAAGQSYGLAVTGLTVTPAGGNLLISLFRPDGQYRGGCNLSFSVKCNWPVGVFDGQPGTYTLVFDPEGANAANFSAVFSLALTGTLSINAPTPTTLTLREGQAARYTFTGTAGQLLKLQISGNNLDDGNLTTTYSTAVQVLNGFSPIGSVYIPTGTATGFIDFTVPANGTYTVQVEPSSLDKGSLGLRLITR